MKTPFTDNSSFIAETFSGLVLTNQQIINVEFEECRFANCRFIECVFENCRFEDCSFETCSLSAVKPNNSLFRVISFRDSKVMGFDWTRARGVNDLNFERCDVSYSNFSFMKLPDLKLIECTAKDVNFSDADLSRGRFMKTDFSESVFSHTNLSGSDFRKAIHYGIDFHFNTLKHARFSLPEALSLLQSLDIDLEV